MKTKEIQSPGFYGVVRSPDMPESVEIVVIEREWNSIFRRNHLVGRYVLENGELSPRESLDWIERHWPKAQWTWIDPKRVIELLEKK